MLNKRIMITIITIMMLSFLTACTSKNEMAMLDVIKKSQEATAKQKGYTANLKSNIQMDMPNMSMHTEVSVDQDITVTNNPRALHSLGTTQVNVGSGNPLQVESYLVNGTMYQKTNGQWYKINSGFIKQLVKQSEQSGDSLKNLYDIIQLYENSQKTDDSKTDEVSMKPLKNGDYQFKIEIKSNKGSQVIKQKVQEIIQNALKDNPAAQNPLMQNLFKNFEINAYKFVSIIDGKTYLLKQANIENKISINVNGMSMSMLQKQDYTIKGPFTGKIEVPADVQANATEINDKQLSGK